jgi:cardiolipin synthase
VLAWVAIILLELLVVGRILLRAHRDPASRIAWITVVLALPVLGIVAYLLLGEVNLGRRQMQRYREARESLPAPASVCNTETLAETGPYAHLFKLGKSISGFTAVAGNAASLLQDSNASIDAMVTDIDAARDHVHLSFYIWLADNNGCKIIDAVTRAAKRGVSCRALADGLGSRPLIHSEHWQAMRDAGVQLGIALPIGNPLSGPLRGRIDLRNHRKIVVIDHTITYCGSQNCADPEFRVKAKYAPWVDILARFTGPVVSQNQYLFASDWMLATEENLGAMLQTALPTTPQQTGAGFSAQVIGTGPTYRNSAMPEVFIALLNAAREVITLSTPYYVPNEAMQHALCATAYRGVDTTLIVPARNDSRFVAAASRSHYPDLLEAGVRIFEYQPGLLHAKTLTLDGKIALIGSANMDRRSFDLNFENNILLYDEILCAQIHQRQQNYIEDSRVVGAAELEQMTLWQRLWNNSLAMLSPVL